jgi:hypothetical protein
MLCGTEPFPELFRAKKYKIHDNYIHKKDFKHMMLNLPVPVKKLIITLYEKEKYFILLFFLSGIVLCPGHVTLCCNTSEPVFVNVLRAQESILRNRFR